MSRTFRKQPNSRMPDRGSIRDARLLRTCVGETTPEMTIMACNSGCRHCFNPARSVPVSRYGFCRSVTAVYYHRAARHIRLFTIRATRAGARGGWWFEVVCAQAQCRRENVEQLNIRWRRYLTCSRRVTRRHHNRPSRLPGNILPGMANISVPRQNST